MIFTTNQHFLSTNTFCVEAQPEAKVKDLSKIGSSKAVAVDMYRHGQCRPR